MDDYCIAVFDIGKTNKKLLIFDSRLKIIDSAFQSFSEVTEGDICLEDTDNIEAWMVRELKDKASRYPIGVISISTHGATFAAIASDGSLAVPVVSYTTEVDDDFNREFYDTFGDVKALQRVTATPRFDALINVGKGVFFVKKRFPQGFDKIHSVLGFPQYFGYRLTGRTGAEWTYLGCHTYLWDFKKGRWSSVARDLGIEDKLPSKISHPWDILGTIRPEIAEETGLSSETVVTMGIHDSNASLLPYLIKVKDEFVLDSTGTWCVLMHPTRRAEFQEDDLGRVVFFNLDAFAHPVKTAIFVGGMEFDIYRDLFKSIGHDKTEVVFDKSLYQKIIDEKRLFILPEVFHGSGQFPGSRARIVEDGKVHPLEDAQSGLSLPAFFRQPQTAIAVLMLSLAIQTKVSLERTGFNRDMSLFIEGGFRRNEAYRSLLAAFYSDYSIFLTGMQEASAFGAAILGKLAVEKIDPEAVAELFEIDFHPVAPVALNGLEGYMADFHKLIEDC